MKKFNGYSEAKKAASYSNEKLPEGAYICKVLNVKYHESNDSSKGDMIELSFDIAEGEYKEFFKRQYQNNQNEDKKWKGRVYIYCPLDDGSERDGWTKTAFAKWTNSLEESNNGYVWDWDEQKWTNKIVGIVFGKTGTVIDGKEIVYTEARFPVAISEVKNGKAPVAKFKAKNGYTGRQAESGASGSAQPATTDPWQTVDSEDDGLPFNI